MIKLKTFLAAMAISFTAQAVQSMPVEQLIDTGMLKEGTRIGKCEVLSLRLLRAYGSGPVSAAQLVVSDGSKEVMALLNPTLNVIDQNGAKIMTSSLNSTTGGDSHYDKSLEKNTSLEVTIKTKEQDRVTQLSIEKKKANFFGSMKTVPSESISCGD